jgi:hypothetical protein
MWEMFHGPVGNMMLIGLIGLAMPVVGIVARAWIQWDRRRARSDGTDRNAVESVPGYRRCVAVAAWNGGTQRSWDYAVRPILAELTASALADQYSHADWHQAGHALLGDSLWPLVDPDAPKSQDLRHPGPSRQTLEEIIGLIEAAASGDCGDIGKAERRAVATNRAPACETTLITRKSAGRCSSDWTRVPTILLARSLLPLRRRPGPQSAETEGNPESTTCGPNLVSTVCASTHQPPQ